MKKPITAYTKNGQRQIRDGNGNIIAVLPMIGSGYSTNQSWNQTRRRAHAIARILNKHL